MLRGKLWKKSKLELKTYLDQLKSAKPPTARSTPDYYKFETQICYTEKGTLHHFNADRTFATNLGIMYDDGYNHFVGYIMNNKPIFHEGYYFKG